MLECMISVSREVTWRCHRGEREEAKDSAAFPRKDGLRLVLKLVSISTMDARACSTCHISAVTSSPISVSGGSYQSQTTSVHHNRRPICRSSLSDHSGRRRIYGGKLGSLPRRCIFKHRAVLTATPTSPMLRLDHPPHPGLACQRSWMAI